MAQLARHVLPKTKQATFDKWVKVSLTRLSQLYPLRDGAETDPTVRQGIPVLQEIFDSAFEFRVEMTGDLLRDFLLSLDYSNNPYLRSPEEMTKMGFEGTPYRI
jgi:hypothetical protein